MPRNTPSLVSSGIAFPVLALMKNTKRWEFVSMQAAVYLEDRLDAARCYAVHSAVKLIIAPVNVKKLTGSNSARGFRDGEVDNPSVHIFAKFFLFTLHVL